MATMLTMQRPAHQAAFVSLLVEERHVCFGILYERTLAHHVCTGKIKHSLLGYMVLIAWVKGWDLGLEDGWVSTNKKRVGETVERSHKQRVPARGESVRIA